MSCSTHQRIPPSMWRAEQPTSAAGATELPAHRRKRTIRTFGMLSVAGEDAVEALVERVAGHVKAGTMTDQEASDLLAEELHEISHEYPEAFDDDVVQAVADAMREAVS